MAASSAAVAAHTHRLCTGSTAPKSVNVPSPVKPGRNSGSLPNRISAMPRSTTATPSVMVMRMKCGASRTGASVRRSCAAATAAPASVAITIAGSTGTPCGDQRGGHDAAEHDELALREVHDAGDVGGEHEAERHQRVDAAGRQAGQQELEEDVHAFSSRESLPLRQESLNPFGPLLGSDPGFNRESVSKDGPGTTSPVAALRDASPSASSSGRGQDEVGHRRALSQ